MQRKVVNKKDILSVIVEFQTKLQREKPTYEQMYEEIRMMQFKVRPLYGDISYIDLGNKLFVEVLWNLGKLDDFYRREGFKYTRREREIFYRFFDSLHDKFVRTLQSAQLMADSTQNHESPQVEMEIYREEVRKSRFN